METAKLTVRLPRRDLEFAEAYARMHRISVSELIDRYLRSLQARSTVKVRPEMRQGSTDPWQEFFRLGDALVSEDGPETESLTAAVLSMRR